MPEKPSHAVIWVAKTYPPWQSLVLTTLKKLYEVKQSINCLVSLTLVIKLMLAI